MRGLDESVTAWHADEYHYKLDEEAIIFVGEMIAKEDINSANGCDEFGIELCKR